MEDWTAMQVMKAAHQVGLRKLGEFERAVARLKEGETAEPVATFEEMLAFFSEDLKMHFRHEEQGLFPVLGKVIGRAGPVGAMLEEHDSLWRAIDTFSELVPELKGADAAQLAGLVPQVERVAQHIIWILTGHIQKEDTMLFPLAEKTLDAAGRREVDENLAVLDVMYRS